MKFRLILIVVWICRLAKCQQQLLDCNFDQQNFCRWLNGVNNVEDDFDWRIDNSAPIDGFHSIPRTVTGTGYFAYAQGQFRPTATEAARAWLQSPPINGLVSPATLNFLYWKTAVPPILQTCVRDSSGSGLRCYDTISGLGDPKWTSRSVTIPPNALPFQIILVASSFRTGLDLIGVDDITVRYSPGETLGQIVTGGPPGQQLGYQQQIPGQTFPLPYPSQVPNIYTQPFPSSVPVFPGSPGIAYPGGQAPSSIITPGVYQGRQYPPGPPFPGSLLPLQPTPYFPVVSQGGQEILTQRPQIPYQPIGGQEVISPRPPYQPPIGGQEIISQRPPPYQPVATQETLTYRPQTPPPNPFTFVSPVVPTNPIQPGYPRAPILQTDPFTSQSRYVFITQSTQQPVYNPAPVNPPPPPPTAVAPANYPQEQNIVIVTRGTESPRINNGPPTDGGGQVFVNPPPLNPQTANPIHVTADHHDPEHYLTTSTDRLAVQAAPDTAVVDASGTTGQCSAVACVFNKDFCKWYNDLSSQFDWKLKYAPIPYQGAGYIFVTGDFRKFDQRASIKTPSFVVPVESVLEFLAFVSDAESGRLGVYVDDSSNPGNLLWKATGHKTLGGSGWRRIRVPLPASSFPTTISLVADQLSLGQFVGLDDVRLTDKSGFDIGCASDSAFPRDQSTVTAKPSLQPPTLRQAALKTDPKEAVGSNVARISEAPISQSEVFAQSIKKLDRIGGDILLENNDNENVDEQVAAAVKPIDKTYRINDANIVNIPNTSHISIANANEYENWLQPSKWTSSLTLNDVGGGDYLSEKDRTFNRRGFIFSDTTTLRSNVNDDDDEDDQDLATTEKSLIFLFPTSRKSTTDKDLDIKKSFPKQQLLSLKLIKNNQTDKTTTETLTLDEIEESSTTSVVGFPTSGDPLGIKEFVYSISRDLRDMFGLSDLNSRFRQITSSIFRNNDNTNNYSIF